MCLASGGHERSRRSRKLEDSSRASSRRPSPGNCSCQSRSDSSSSAEPALSGNAASSTTASALPCSKAHSSRPAAQPLGHGPQRQWRGGQRNEYRSQWRAAQRQVGGRWRGRFAMDVCPGQRLIERSLPQGIGKCVGGKASWIVVHQGRTMNCRVLPVQARRTGWQPRQVLCAQEQPAWTCSPGHWRCRHRSTTAGVFSMTIPTKNISAARAASTVLRQPMRR